MQRRKQPGIAFSRWTLRGSGWKLAILCALWAGLGACTHSSSPPDRLPASNEVENWIRGEVDEVTDQTGIYTRIDGGAPQYLDRGWVGALYAIYTQGGVDMQVAIHDMGTPAGAQSIYEFSLPAARIAIPGLQNAVVQMSLDSAYAAFAYAGRFYVEVNIGAKTDATWTSIELFMADILEHHL